MKAMVLAFAANVSESAFGRLWSKVAEVLDMAIPIALFALIVVGSGAVIFGFVH